MRTFEFSDATSHKFWNIDLHGKTKKPGSNFEGSCRFARGWLDNVEARDYTVAFTRLLAHSPEIRLLRRLVLDDNAFEMEDEYESGDDIPEDCEDPQLYPLV